MYEPLLHSTTVPDEQGRRIIHAYGGLHNIRGNHAPYFTLTMGSWIVHGNGRKTEDCFGAAHDELVKLWPDLADLAAMHLSDIDGVPMHPEANGWYWLAGALGGAGERYHGGNTTPAKSQDECLRIFADHVRVPVEEAESIKVRVIEAGEKGCEVFNAILAEMRPRWKREAEECIARHNLKVFGDHYEVVS